LRERRLSRATRILAGIIIAHEPGRVIVLPGSSCPARDY